MVFTLHETGGKKHFNTDYTHISFSSYETSLEEESKICWQISSAS